jgi:gamma-glutamyltranspeptidase / glutathione hydrolase
MVRRCLLVAAVTLALAAGGCRKHGSKPGAPPAAAAASSAPAPPGPPPKRIDLEPLVPSTEMGPVPTTWKYPLDAPSVSAQHGIVVSDSQIATHVGAQILASGGNAVDAAVATAFALAAALPEAGNLGGGGFAVVRTPDGKNAALDFREMAPRKATRDMYLGPDGKPTLESLQGHRASGVPGSVAGLWELHQRYGKTKWAQLVAPAIALAEKGFVVDPGYVESIQGQARRLAKFPASAALFLPGGAPPAVGSTWKDPDLAKVLRRIADRGPAGFYQGETAKLIADEMRRGFGLITVEDLAGYKAKWRTPLEGDYRGHHLITMPLPSSGGMAVIMIAKILEGYDVKELGYHSPKHLHVLVEAERRAFADRNSVLGDPDFVKIPAAALLSDAYLARKRATIDLGRATPSADIRPGPTEGTQTTHLGVVDGNGMAVALTTTLNQLYGSAVTVTGAGFVMNDEMDDFAAKPGTANLFGLVQGEKNRIEPGKRPLSSMAPTIVLSPNGKVLMVAGARGGPRIISATFQEISNVLDFGMDVAAAVNAPRIHHQHLPDLLYFEDGGLTEAERRGLAKMGHALQPQRIIAEAPAILRAGDHWTAMPDARRGGGAEGY